MSKAKDRWDAATAAYNDAVRWLENAAPPYVAELVLKHYPTASKLFAWGEMNSDYVYNLRVQKLVLANGTEVEELDGTGHIDEAFEAMTEDVEEVLNWLIEVNVDEYLNETEIEVAAFVS